MVWSHATADINRDRLLATSSPHSGDWLAAPPITSVGLRLSDEEIRIAVAHRHGCKVCELVQEIGRRTTSITGDVRESTFLFQQLSVALERGNAVSFQNTFITS